MCLYFPCVFVENCDFWAMDILPSVDIFKELQDIHDTGYFSAQPSLDDHWQQVNYLAIKNHVTPLLVICLHLTLHLLIAGTSIVMGLCVCFWGSSSLLLLSSDIIIIKFLQISLQHVNNLHASRSRDYK